MRAITNIAVLGASVLALAGCRTGYDVDVRNQADQPVVVSIVTQPAESGARLLATSRLGPGDRTGLFAQTDPRQHVWVEADFAGNTGDPAKLDLTRGRTAVNVRRADQGSRGRLLLEEAPLP